MATNSDVGVPIVTAGSMGQVPIVGSNLFSQYTTELSGRVALITFGGDHPSNQYAVTPDCKQGLHRIPLDRGLVPYLAINTRAGNEAVAGSTGMLSWGQVKALQDQGVTIISHGVGPHKNSWRCAATGILLRYLGTGTACTVTCAVNVNYPAKTLTAAVTGASDGFGTLDLTVAPYNTLASLANYLNTFNNGQSWECIVDPALDGTESSLNLNTNNALTTGVPLDLAPVVTITYTLSPLLATVTLANHGLWPGAPLTVAGATPAGLNITTTVYTVTGKDTFTYVPSATGIAGPGTATGTITIRARRPLSAGSGLVLYYTPTTIAGYKKVDAEFLGTSFRLYGDGVALCNFTLTGNTSYNTLYKLKTQIDALAIAGLTCDLCDDRRTGTNANPGASNPFSSGDEDSSNLEQFALREITAKYTRLNAGLPGSYIIREIAEGPISDAAAYGVTIKHFAQSGSHFTSDLAATLGTSLREKRGNPAWLSFYPYLTPVCMLPQDWHPHFEPNDGVVSPGSYTGHDTEAKLRAIVKACATSPGFMTDILTHSVAPTSVGNVGVSGYALPASNNTQDLAENLYVAFIDEVSKQAATGGLVPVTYDTLFEKRSEVKPPVNWIPNPKFITAAPSLVGACATQDLSANAAWMPSTMPYTPASITEFTSDQNGFITVTSNSATSMTLLKWRVPIPTGVNFELAIDLEYLAYGGASTGFNWAVYPVASWWQNIVGGPLVAKSSETFSKTGRMSMTFCLDVPKPMRPYLASAYVAPATGWNVPTASTSRINFGSGWITGINLAGATATATKPYEVANAINTAIQTAINAGTLDYTYANAATVVSNGTNFRVVITHPQEMATHSTSVSVATDTGSDQVTPIFGNALTGGRGQHSLLSTGEAFPIQINLVMANNGRVRLGNISLRPVTSL